MSWIIFSSSCTISGAFLVVRSPENIATKTIRASNRSSFQQLAAVLYRVACHEETVSRTGTVFLEKENLLLGLHSAKKEDFNFLLFTVFRTWFTIFVGKGLQIVKQKTFSYIAYMLHS